MGIMASGRVSVAGPFVIAWLGYLTPLLHSVQLLYKVKLSVFDNNCGHAILLLVWVVLD